MDGGRTTKRQYSEYSDFFLHNENQSTIKIQTYISGNPPKSDGADKTGDASRILVWGTPRTTGRGGHMRISSIRTQSVSGQNSRWAANVEREVGQPAIGYLKKRADSETVGGISRGSVPYLHQTDRIVRRRVATFRRAMQIDLRVLRKTDIGQTAR